MAPSAREALLFALASGAHALLLSGTVWSLLRPDRRPERAPSEAAAGAPVFVAEHVVPGPETPHFAKLFDVHMMVATEGRERTVEEYGELFEEAGMELAGHHRRRAGR